ncbi:toprim domain-containing protein [Thermomonospora sp. CIF 1]|uniref:toprim domain-containing protein n=1 Tax=Thermomonospora sp. CIF 1 TaxID=1916083 RepID=UPI000CB1945B|nr:toprim domain-containing protein [Thermomonospora sp. CIF 1]PKK13195.1 MAG: hypothetical protein BUE48_017020 [Thermomonospora sp. CIF 1]
MSTATPVPQAADTLQGVAEQETSRLLTGSRPWTWWLEQAARHGRHGFCNTVLIAAQRPAATDVRSPEEWRAAGRRVKSGERGIRILAPDGRRRAVYDISQTSGPPPRPQQASPQAAVARLRIAADSLGLQVDHDAPVGPDTLTALALRLGHRLLPAHTTSVAYLVLAHLGVPVPPLVYPRVRAWAADAAAVAAAGERILRAARVVTGRLDLVEAARECLAAAHAFFRARAPGSWVPAHLAERGLGPDALERWQIGYAPASWRALTGHLLSSGHRPEAIVAAGLARRGRNGALYDLFRDRAMFALRDGDGAIAGFIGRLREGAAGPKYLNSPESPLFRKGRLLYGLQEARGRLEAGARPVLVEGPFDALAVNAASPAHAAVATCGSAVTQAQVRALLKVWPRVSGPPAAGGLRQGADGPGVLVMPDGDAAGRAAALRAWEVLAKVGAPVDAVLLAEGGDPADVLRRRGPAALRGALASAHPLADLAVDAAVARAGGALHSPEDRVAALRAAAAVIAGMAPGHVARQVGRVAARLDLDHATVTSALVEAVTGATEAG